MRKGFLTMGVIRNLRGVKGLCPVCGGPLRYNPRTGMPGQWAHFLCNTKPHIRRYGKEIIDSRHNGIRVCGLKCNNAVQLNYKSQPILCDELAIDIEYLNMEDRIAADRMKEVVHGTA